MSELKKITISTLDLCNGDITVSTMYNPKELSFTKAVNWSDNQNVGSDFPLLSFEKGNPIDLSIELFFDKYETGGDVREEVRKIVQLCQINDCKESSGIASSKSSKRPPKVEVLWGDGDVLGIGKKFQGVLTSAQTKYTMFTSNGIPCRASVTVTIKQADAVGYTASSKSSGEGKVTFASAQQIAATPGAQEYFELKGKRVEELKFPVSATLGKTNNNADA